MIRAISVLAAAVCMVTGVALMGAEGESVFPAITGKSLAGEEFRVPKGFTAEHNLVLVAFLREQQKSIDTWIPRMEELEDSNEGFAFYEFPVLPKMNAIAKWWIYQGMRSGIRSEQARARTVTFHIDKAGFKQHLGIATEDSIQVFLLNRDGMILWRSTGEWSRSKEDALRRALGEEADEVETPEEGGEPGDDR